MDLLPIFLPILIFGSALTLGQQITSDGCFQIWTNSMVNCLAPYDTRTGLTDQQCRDICVRNPSSCKAVQYNGNSQTCQLYQKAVDSQTRHGGGGCRPGPGPGPGRGPMGPGPGPGRPGPPYRPPPVPPPRGGRKKRHGGSGGRSHGRGHGHGCGGGGGGGGGACIPGLKPSNGYTYYQTTGQCGGGPFTVVTLPTTTIGSLPAGATCPSGQVIRYFLVDGYQLSGPPDATFTAGSEQACIDACTNNRLPDGRQVPCRLFDFDTTTSTCSISFAGTGVAQGTPNAQIKHYEKTCVDSAFGNRCPGPYFRGSQRILIGYAQAIAGATSAAECLQTCSNSQARFGFVCQSIVYYSQEATNNCILNSETRLNHPDLYQAETADQVDYYEIGCNAVRALRATRLTGIRNRNVLVPNSNDYSGWTMCDHKILDHKRYRRCQGMNPNKCEEDKAQCDPAKEDDYDLPTITTSIFLTSTSTSTMPSNENDCEPMIRPNGGRDCQNGSRRTRNGRREWCKPAKC